MINESAFSLLMMLFLFSAVGCGASGLSSLDAGDSDQDIGSCETLRNSMSMQVARGMHMQCTGVVRFDYLNLNPLGYAIFCADAASVDEAAARAAAALDLDLTSIPSGPDAGDLISDPSSSIGSGDELFVFYKQPNDFGHVAVVNARNSKTLFGGSIVRMGSGAILYPQQWGPPSALGEGCRDSLLSLDHVGSFDLSQSGGPVPESQGVMEVLMDTVLPGALLDGTAAYLKNAVILLYPPTVGAFDPASAEYVVFVNAGWE